jgi:uncharacterized protein (TIGR04255 family)
MVPSISSPPYPAPPIVEAIVQVRFADSLTKAQDSKMLRRLKAATYKNHVPMDSVSANVDFHNRRADFDAEHQIRLSSSDEADVLVVHTNALTWSRLAPYEGWERLLERVKLDFVAAYDVAGYRKIDRLGVRYVNRIDVPMIDDIAHYEHFLTAHLNLPDLLQPTNGYAWRVEKSFPNQNLRTIVQSAASKPVIPGMGAFLLDIDVICHADLPAKAEDVFARLDEMRKLKNEIFELCITNTARAAFQ